MLEWGKVRCCESTEERASPEALRNASWKKCHLSWIWRVSRISHGKGWRECRRSKLLVNLRTRRSLEWLGLRGMHPVKKEIIFKFCIFLNANLLNLYRKDFQKVFQQQDDMVQGPGQPSTASLPSILKSVLIIICWAYYTQCWKTQNTKAHWTPLISLSRWKEQAGKNHYSLSNGKILPSELPETT